MIRPYRGRFAPSPTGPLHQGSLISALASYLDARAHDGEWLVRIEDIDGPRTVPGIDDDILETLAAYGMHADAPPIWQHARTDAYQQAFDQLQQSGRVYPCGCTRREIADSLISMHSLLPADGSHPISSPPLTDSPHSVDSTHSTDSPYPSLPTHDAHEGHVRNTTLAYPGTCRTGLHGRAPRAWRLRVPDGDAALIAFDDRWQGRQTQDLSTEVGDFALKRADGLWAYQLAVVVDDAASGITDIVRGQDLLDSTPRQIYLQRCLGVPTPRYLHVPVLNNAVGEKLSKQNGATALPRDAAGIRGGLMAAARFLGLDIDGRIDIIALDAFLPAFYRLAIAAWRDSRYGS